MARLTKKRFLMTKDDLLPAFEQVKENLGEITQRMREAATLAECFTVFGFTAQETQTGDLLITGYQETDQPFEMFFMVIAPYVKKGSYLHFEDEDGPVKFQFDGTELNMEVVL